MDAKLPFSSSQAPATTTTNLSTKAEPAKVKPCCVCKDEKAKRDECMLFSKAADPAKDCMSMVDQYKSCMAGFGFQV